MSETVTYSLWLEPSGDIAYRLRERIRTLSEKQNTPSFPPHVTLLGGLQATATELIPLTNTLASSLHPFELKLTRAGYTNRYYQSLFVHVEENKELKEVRNIACRLFGISDGNNFMPHLSLLYGDLSQKEKERILNFTGREFYIRFPVKSVVLMNTDGKPEQWKKIHTSVFRNF